MGNGGFGEHVAAYFSGADMPVVPQILNIAVADQYVEHGNVEILKKELGMDAESVVKQIVAVYKKE